MEYHEVKYEEEKLEELKKTVAELTEIKELLKLMIIKKYPELAADKPTEK